MQKKNNYFSNVPGWQKGLIALGGAAFLYYVLFKQTKKAEEQKALVGATNELNSINQEIEQSSGESKNYSPAQYNTWANNLFVAMDGYQTDEDAIFNIFKLMKNKLDVLELIKAFGIREISSGYLNPEPNVKGTLSQCLTSELNSSEMTELNSILNKAGIDYKF